MKRFMRDKKYVRENKCNKETTLLQCLFPSNLLLSGKWIKIVATQKEKNRKEKCGGQFPTVEFVLEVNDQITKW